MAKGGGGGGGGGGRSGKRSSAAAGSSGSSAAGGGGGSYRPKRQAVTSRARDKTRRQGPRLFEDPAHDERLLAAQLTRLGLYAANTIGDGSCLFRALSDQLHGTPNYHLAIRHEVCNFLLANSGQFVAFIDDSLHASPEAAYAAHVAEMRNPATYGTQVEIVAFARMVQRRVKVIQAELIYVIGCEDESPSAKEKRAKSQDPKGKGKATGEDLPDLYIVYHNWEHYSSARNIGGPHSGLPHIVELKPPAPSETDTPATSAPESPSATPEESLILSSLRFPHRHNVAEIRRLINDNDGSWEQALEVLLENEIDETESEDFNVSSPPPPTTTTTTTTASSTNATTTPTTGTPSRETSVAESLPTSRSHNTHQNQHYSHPLQQVTINGHRPTPSTDTIGNRSSSPSTSTSTAASTATQHSTSTTATQLTDVPETSLQQHLDGRKASASPSTSLGVDSLRSSTLHSADAPTSSGPGSSRVRSRAASPDPEISAAESPRQKFRIAKDDGSSELISLSSNHIGVGTLHHLPHHHDHHHHHPHPHSLLQHRRMSNEDREDSSSFGGDFNDDHLTNLDSSSVVSVSSGSGSGSTSAVEETDHSTTPSTTVTSRDTGRNASHSASPAPAGPPPPPSSVSSSHPHPPLPAANETPKRPRGRPPKKKDALALVAGRPPTRRQRKQMAKSGISSPVGGRTRSKVGPAKEEAGLQRDFKELFV